MKATHYTLLAVLAVAGLGGCATNGVSVPDAAVDRSQDILLAEIARSRGQVEKAADFYARAASLSDSESLIGEGTMYAVRAETWPEAVRLSRRWTELRPDSGAANWWRGLSELHAGELDAAVTAYGKAMEGATAEDWRGLASELAAHPRRWRAWQLARRLAARHEGAGPRETAARMALAVDRYGDAARYTARARRQAPDSDALAWLDLRVRLLSGDPFALADARVRVATDPTDAARLELANLLWIAGREEAVVRLLSPHGEAPRERPAVAFALALAEADTGRIESARQRFHRLVGTGFRIREIWFQLGLLAEDADQPDIALTLYDRIRSGSRHLPAQARALQVLMELGREEEVDERIRRLEERLMEQRHAFRVEAGATLALNGYLERGEVLCRRALTARPDDANAWYRCGLTRLVARPDDRLGIEWLEAALERWPEEPDLLNGLGYSLVVQDRSLHRAGRLIQRALTRSPDSGAFMDSRGWLAYRRGRPREALEWVERAWERTPSAEVAAHRVELHWVLDRRARAEQIYRNASERWSDDPVLERTWQRLAH